MMESPKCCSQCRARANSAKSGTRRASCYDKFAFAKKLHAENLEHQPLPDRVDDSIFKNVKSQKSCRRVSSGRCGCCGHKGNEDVDRNLRYGPVLGCKKPETTMDLAICWETPLNPIYEPPRATHIDGSEGGLAPAIFALVQHTPTSTRACLRSDAIEPQVRCKCKDNPVEDEGKNRKSVRSPSSRSTEPKIDQDFESPDREDQGSVKSRCSCDCLCKDLKNLRLPKPGGAKDSPRRYRKCAACQKKKSARDDPRLIKSAVGLALGIGKMEGNQRRNGLSSKITIPRPRTPFARRSFCIDTLAPPFSIVNGCRDADYPEHWRLMSIYQQSYKDPAKRRHF